VDVRVLGVFSVPHLAPLAAILAGLGVLYPARRA
jgi:hypothetical protein